MNSDTKVEGERFSLYFPPSQEKLFNYVSEQFDENGKKINRNKFILKIIEEHYQNQHNKLKVEQSHQVNQNNVSNQELLDELQILKKMIGDIKIIESTSLKNSSNEESMAEDENSNSSSISLTKEELQQLNNPMF